MSRSRVWLAPHVRGRVTPRMLDHLRSSGWHVHQLGQAAYVHQGGVHLLLGVWRRRDPDPAWVARLGRASDGYLRRLERVSVEQRGRYFLRDDAGRFVARLPWWRWPGPTVYSFDSPALSLHELARGAA